MEAAQTLFCTVSWTYFEDVTSCCMAGVPWCENTPSVCCLKRRALSLACLVSNSCIFCALVRGRVLLLEEWVQKPFPDIQPQEIKIHQCTEFICALKAWPGTRSQLKKIIFQRSFASHIKTLGNPAVWIFHSFFEAGL